MHDARYAQIFGEDERAILRRLLDAGVAGIAEVRQYLADHEYPEPNREPVASDTRTTEYELVREERDRGVLQPKSGMYPVGSDAEPTGYAAVREQDAHHAPYSEPDIDNRSSRMPRPPSVRRHWRGKSAAPPSCAVPPVPAGLTSCFASGMPQPPNRSSPSCSRTIREISIPE